MAAQLREQGTAPGPVRSASVCAKYSEEHICVESDATDENDGKMGSLSLSLSLSYDVPLQREHVHCFCGSCFEFTRETQTKAEWHESHSDRSMPNPQGSRFDMR